MDFDKVSNRYGTYSTQWDYTADRFGSADVLPFSISDTDFPVPDLVIKQLQKRLKHPIFGYTRWNHDDFKQSIVRWYKGKHCDINPQWISYSPSVIFSVAAFIRMKSNPGDGVIIFTPMYDALYNVIIKNNRKLVKVPLGDAYNSYQMDWDCLERKLSAKENKILVLTNPHNPTGKVFSRSEIHRIISLCEQYNVFLISDDIHMDIIFDGNQYYPILNECTADNQDKIVICTSSSKTFNTPGLTGSYVLIPDLKNFDKFQEVLKQQNGLSSASIMGIIALMASYQCDDYVKQLIEYISHNMNLLENFCQQHSQLGLDFIKPQGTYLAWIKITCDLSEQEIEKRLIEKGKVGIMAGSVYDGMGYLRMNLACPESKLNEGLSRIKLALT